MEEINFKVKIVKDTKNSCISCGMCNTYIYCPIFAKIMYYRPDIFDETGEKDGCDLFRRIGLQRKIK